MHSPDPNKAQGELNELFHREIKRILESAEKAEGDGIADFSQFVFFGYFDFSNTTIRVSCDFSNAVFEGPATFQRTTFDQAAFFRNTVFVSGVSFSQTTFAQVADFTHCRFLEDCRFSNANFNETALFPYAIFGKFTEFSEAFIGKNVDFAQARFSEGVHFGRSQFMGAADFRSTDFLHSEYRNLTPDFSAVTFAEPKFTFFYNNDLSRAAFANTDISQVSFSSVTWARRMNNLKSMVYEEVVDTGLLDSSDKHLLSKPDSPDERNFRIIAELYQQLKKNYDERRDYWTAGDFHYGEMEMKRLSVSEPGSVSRVWIWLAGHIGFSPKLINGIRRAIHQNLSLVAWYRYASDYGENYLRPAMWLFFVLILFTVLYPITGLSDTRLHSPVMVPAVRTYWRPALDGPSYTHACKARCQLIMDSAIVSLEIGAFQKDRDLEPAGRVGHVLMLVEIFLTSTLVGLFFLAIRRQFKR
jgi:uncharacterized protein YjbI with pentapeptide repeats